MSDTIAHYTILERLGEGSLGEVYRARDMKYGRTVVLKVTPPADDVDPAIRQRFLDDARAAASLSHPNIATLFDVGEHGNRYYMAYEFVAGTPLRQQMAGRPMNPRHALEIAVQIAEALAEAHSRGIIHTDLRPETIFVSGKGSSKVLDFGMAGWTRGGDARRRAASAPESLDADAAAVVPYMSPEQAIGGSLDARTDLFSLGVIVYEMLTGRNPWAAATPAETLVNITHHSTPPAAAPAGLPKEIEPALSRVLAKDINARHQNAVALASELRQVAAALDGKAGEAPPPSVITVDDARDGAGKVWVWLLVIAAAAAAIWFALR